MTNKPLRIALLSSTQFGYQCLQEGILPVSDIEVVGILTTPQKIEISYSNTPVVIRTHAKFDDLAVKAGCEVVEMTGKMNSANYLQYLDVWKPDILLVLGWYYMVPRKVREAVPMGAAGIHASLLPKYRGGAPLVWAIINGESETGVTFFYFEDGVDNGDIIAQEHIPIDHEDTIATVYDKAIDASTFILKQTLPKLADGTAPRIPQDETKATYVDQRSPADGLIDWSWDETRIRNFIRAQTKPYPGAYTIIEGKKVVIWDADIHDLEDHT